MTEKKQSAVTADRKQVHISEALWRHISEATYLWSQNKIWSLELETRSRWDQDSQK